MKIPYGVADFYRIRSRGQVYIDRTDRIATVEDMADSLLFLRPRRFGKSLWLSTLAYYYDLRYADEHEMLFGDLAIGKAPTPLAHRYFVMRWDFSQIDPDPPPWGVNAGVNSRKERIGNEIRGYLNAVIETFLREYKGHLPESVYSSLHFPEGTPLAGSDPFRNIERLLAVIRQTPYPLYLLIDEYDNFANEILTDDTDAYREVVKSDGPFKYLFKWVKGQMAGAGLERLFITGVSPMVMSDVTSGLNIARNVSLKSALADLCGFLEKEIDDLIPAVLAKRGDCELSASAAKLTMREWYNGYRFALMSSNKIYNPTLAFYYLLELLEEGSSPRQMLDANLAADEGKLDHLTRVSAVYPAEGEGPVQDKVFNLLQKNEPLEILQLLDRFTLKDLLERSAQDVNFFGSYLFYFGMLTLKKEEDAEGTLKLAVPNEVVRNLYVDHIRKTLMPSGEPRSVAAGLLISFLNDGEIEPLLDFVESTLFPSFSNRDSAWANELTIKTIFLALLWDSRGYIIHSEPELDHRYADLCLLRRPDIRVQQRHDLLLEFKRLSLKELRMSGKDVKASSRDELMKLAKVRGALDDAEDQIDAYRAALKRSRGDTLKLRSFAVVALGFEGLVFRPL